MKLFKNITKHPKTTQKGLKYNIGMAIITIAVTEIAGSRPELADLINQNREYIYSCVTGLILLVQGVFNAKEDKEDK